MAEVPRLAFMQHLYGTFCVTKYPGTNKSDDVGRRVVRLDPARILPIERQEKVPCRSRDLVIKASSFRIATSSWNVPDGFADGFECLPPFHTFHARSETFEIVSRRHHRLVSQHIVTSRSHVQD